MKKILLGLSFVALCTSGYAQKSNIRSAKNNLSDKQFEKAVTAIDAAVANPDTKDDPTAWHVRSMVYFAMQQAPGNEEKKYYQEAVKSLYKVVELKPTFEKKDVNNKLLAAIKYYFNDGIRAYDAQKYGAAYDYFGEVNTIYKIGDGNRFAGNKNFDTIATQAATYQGYSAYYNKEYDKALPLLLAAKNNPIVKDVRNYLMIADIYEIKGDEANLLATIQEGKAAYPNDQSMSNRELNYYVKSGQSETLIAKLNDAISKDPNNADLLFNLAIAYDNMANPKDNKENPLPAPANYDDLFSKAETAYANTLKVAPSKPEVSYNYGALYFNRAVLINEEMNKITGNSTEANKKFDALKAQRNSWFNKALPHFEKVVSLMEPKASTLKGEDFNTYVKALSTAKEIYAKQNKLEKATELGNKLKALQH